MLIIHATYQRTVVAIVATVAKTAASWQLTDSHLDFS